MTDARRYALARLPALSDAVALLFERDPQAVRYIARTLREAGLIATGKRGLGSAEMTSRDAAMMLLGLSESRFGADFVAAASTWANLPVRKRMRDEATPALVETVLRRRTFIDALQILIDGAGQLPRGRAADEGLNVSVSVHCLRPKAVVAFHWGGRDWSGVGRPAIAWASFGPARSAPTRGVDPVVTYDTSAFIELHATVFA
jgi:hypothetical protein